MRGFRSTGILALVVASLIGYAIYDYKDSEKISAENAEKEKILKIETARVSAVKIEKPDETVSLSKEGEQWRLTSPLTDDVELEAATSFLDSLGSEKGSEIERPQTGYNWAEYNLDAPAAKFEIQHGEGPSLSFSVSRLAAFDGRYFVRVGDKLFIGTSAWGGLAAKGSSQLRNKRVLRKTGEVQSLLIETNDNGVKDKVVLTRGDGKWTMDGAMFTVSTAAVEKYIDHLKDLRAIDYFAKAEPISKPFVKVTVKFAKADPPIDDWTLWVAPVEGGSAKASSTAVREAFKLPQFDTEQLGKKKADFRDTKEPFKLAVDEIKEIRIQSKVIGQRVIKKDGTAWKMEGLKEGEEFAPDSLEKIMTQMAQIEAKAFYKAGTKLGEISETVGFVDSAGRLLLELSTGGDVLPDKGQSKGQDLRYVKSNLTKDILGVLASDVAAVTFGSVVRAKAAANVDSSEQR